MTPPLGELPLAASSASGPIIGAAVTALVGVAVAIFTSSSARRKADLERRREIYGQAYKAALSWCEAVYRVRRRAPDGGQDQDLVGHFHDLQERIAYFEGWIATESKEMADAYERFLRAVTAECRPLIQDAWSKPGRPPTDPRPADEINPDVTHAKREFLQQARRHLRLWTEDLKPTINKRP